MRLRFCVQNANGKFSVNKITSATIITSESNLVDSMFISRNISSIFLLIKQACIGSHFNAFGSQDYDWSAHKTPFISWPPACRKVRTWCWNISDVVNNHVTSKQVHDLTINATVLKFAHSFEEYFDHFYVSGYCLCTNRSISKHKCKIVCAGCVRDGRHINLVKCHIGVSFTFLSKILYSFHLFNISKTRQLLYQISPNQPTLVGPHLTEIRLIMWVLYVTLTRVQTCIGDLNCSVVKHVPYRKIGTCWVIWMI